MIKFPLLLCYFISPISRYYQGTTSLNSAQYLREKRTIIIIVVFQGFGLLDCSGFRTYFSKIYESVWKVGRTPWKGGRPYARPLSTQDNTTHKNADTHPSLKRDSNPRSQCSSGRREYVPHTARMRGAIPSLPQYVFMEWCSVKLRGTGPVFFLSFLLKFYHSRKSFRIFGIRISEPEPNFIFHHHPNLTRVQWSWYWYDLPRFSSSSLCNLLPKFVLVVPLT
jgi:hypothetical protein